MNRFTYKQIDRFWNITFWIFSVAMIVKTYYIDLDMKIFYEWNIFVFLYVLFFYIPIAYGIKKFLSFFTKKVIGISNTNINTHESTNKIFFKLLISMFGETMLKLVIITIVVFGGLSLLSMIPFLEYTFVQFVGIYPDDLLFNIGLAYLVFFMPVFIFINIIGSIMYAIYINSIKLQETKVRKRLYESGIIVFTFILSVIAYSHFVGH